ncbi:MAG TPA: M56 family metallopeptidase [Pirellulaceae bacterium]|nr:M56 family metallopeptidase [Pirellulaceae bacterium]
MSELASLLPSGGFARFACDAVWQSALAGLVALAVLWGGRLRPATRAWAALLAMFVAIAAPCGSLLARAGGLGWLPPKGAVVAAAGDEFSGPVDEAAAATPSQASFPSDGEGEVHPPDTPWRAQTAGVSQNGQASSHMALLEASAVTWQRWPGFTPWIWSLWACVWGAASLVLTARLLADLAAVNRLRREAQTCSQEPILAACRRAARCLGLPSAPRVAYSAVVSCPMVLAWGKPCILIPQATDVAPSFPRRHRQDAAAGDQAEFDRWFAVFCHEMGHVRRCDGWSGLVAEAITILLPWQPLIWLLRREFQRGSEEACDDWALFGGVDPLDYAAALAEWIPRRSETLALGIRNRRLPIRRRIERLLAADGRHSPQLGRCLIVGGAGLAASLAIVLALLQSGMPRELVADEVVAHTAAKGVADHVAGGSEVTLDRSSDDAAPPATPAAFQTVLGDARLKHWSYAQSLGFSPDGELALSAGRDGVVQIWNLSSGQSHATFARPHVAAAVSGDGRRLFLAREEGGIEVSDSVTSRVLKTLQLQLPQARSYAVSVLAVNHDGTIAAAGGRCSTVAESSESFLTVWDVRSQRSLMTIRGPQPEWTPGARASWHCLALSADGRRLAAGGLHYITCWDTRTGEQLHKLAGDGRIYALAFSPSGQALASGDALGNVKLWNSTDGGEVLRLDHPATISALAFSPGGERLATSAGNSVHLWDARTGGSLWSYEPAKEVQRSRPVNGGVHFSGDGRKISVGFANRLVLLDAEKGTELPLAGGVPGADFTEVSAALSDGELLTGDTAGRLAMWNFADGRLQRTWQGHAARVDALAISSAGSAFASKATDGSLILWDAKAHKPRHILRDSLLAGGGSEDDSVAFSADGQALASITRQRTLAVWDVESGRLREQLLWAASEGVEQPPAFPSAGRFLLAEWLIGAKTVLPQIGEADRKYPGFQLAVSPDRRYAAGGVYGSRLEIWDLRTRRKTQIARAHAGRLKSLVFSPDSAWLASSGDDGRICFWKPETGQRLASLSVGPPGGMIRKVTVSRDGRHLATINGNGTASILHVPAN